MSFLESMNRLPVAKHLRSLIFFAKSLGYFAFLSCNAGIEINSGSDNRKVLNVAVCRTPALCANLLRVTIDSISGTDSLGGLRQSIHNFSLLFSVSNIMTEW